LAARNVTARAWIARAVSVWGLNLEAFMRLWLSGATAGGFGIDGVTLLNFAAEGIKRRPPRCLGPVSTAPAADTFTP